ncbi:MAG: winged helix-turn-helix transcriptional regulator [Lachnospiraceae bacterium]|nr:winged helix-turn-helix transcriptional regulator [Lachnospiraceae bacterium]
MKTNTKPDTDTQERESTAELKRFNYLNSEINGQYHLAALKMGLSDSTMNILYALCEFGNGCTQRDICNLSGTSKQTINSAIRKLEKEEIIYLKPGNGRDMLVFSTEKGNHLLEEKIHPMIRLENEIFAEMTKTERDALLNLTQKYLDLFAEKLKNLETY